MGQQVEEDQYLLAPKPGSLSAADADAEPGAMAGGPDEAPTVAWSLDEAAALAAGKKFEIRAWVFLRSLHIHDGRCELHDAP
jgi:hypothetical protein